MITKAYEVNFGESIEKYKFKTFSCEWSTEAKGTRIIGISAVLPESVIVEITRNTAEECDEEMEAQIDDGLFENYHCWHQEVK